jgi:V/A-type H+-transporting ATPase subunit I
MFRPQRMAKISAVCLQKDLDMALHALDKFGQFQIETPSNIKFDTYADLIEQAEKVYATLNLLIQKLKTEGRPSRVSISRYEETVRTKFTVDSWSSLLQSLSQETSAIETEVNAALKSTEDLGREETTLQTQLGSLQLLCEFNLEPRQLTEGLVRPIVAKVPLKNAGVLGKNLSVLPSVYYYEPIDNQSAFAFIATMAKDSQVVNLLFDANEVEPLQGLNEIRRSPSEALLEVQRQLMELSRKKKDAQQLVTMISEKYGHRLLVLREAVSNLSNILRTKGRTLQRGQLTEITGFVAEVSVPNLEKQLRGFLKDRFLLFSSNHAKNEDPPTVLRNPSFIKPFEKITALYGLPHYDEIDPTPAMAITFPLIFGLMFGDVGHGIILLLFGLTATFVVKVSEGWKSLLKVLAACGLGSIFAGLLFGEAFGKQVFTPLWLDPFENITVFLIFALLVGAIHIVTGFVVSFANFIIKRQYIDALTVPFVRLIFYVEAIYFLLVCQLNFNLWLSGPLYLLIATLGFLFLGKPMVASILKRGRFLSVFGERLFEGIELMLMLISNTVSYSRILALLIAHWALLTVTYALSSLIAPAPIIGQIAAFIVIVGGNAFVLTFEALMVLVQTLRLHFYEWFSKFYDGSGTRFQPFKYQQKYVEIEFQS